MADKKQLIMLPGPTNVSDRVMKAMERPIINHRGDSFRALHSGILEKTRQLFQTKQGVVVFSSSGTGGVEAAVMNLVRPGDTVVIPVFGTFSERLAEAIELAGGKTVRVNAERGKAPTLQEMESAMAQAGKFKAVFSVHNETSTGVCVPYVKEVAKMARDHGAFMVADAISSLGGYAIPVDEWGVDMCITGSQKCVGAPPGASLVSVSDRVVDFLKESPPRTRYFDIPRHLEYAKKGETPFTPALPVFYALDEALSELVEEGLAKRVERHQRMAALLYQGLGKLGLKFVAAEGLRSNTVVTVAYPEGVVDAQFRKTLSQEKNIVIAGGIGPLSGKIFRVGCMGTINEKSVSTTLSAIGETLGKFRAS